MGRIIDTAKYILEKQGTLSTMKLQKLCYYSQAWSLVWDDAPLFDEDFEAWSNGPVCRELYDIHHGRFSVDAETEGLRAGDSSTLTRNQKDTIDRVLEFYGSRDAQWLSRLTHLERPWKEARGGVPDGEYCASVISKESMGFYYGSL